MIRPSVETATSAKPATGIIRSKPPLTSADAAALTLMLSVLERGASATAREASIDALTTLTILGVALSVTDTDAAPSRFADLANSGCDTTSTSDEPAIGLASTILAVASAEETTVASVFTVT